VHWPGAGSAPYNNVIGVDPELTDPENGDYRPVPGSPAEGYGCQTFLRRPAAPPVERPSPGGATRVLRGDVVEVSGPVTTDTTWEAETIRVVGDVAVADGVTLTIAAGVRVVFADYHHLDVQGTLLAVGTAADRILFTTDEPEHFVVDESHTGCWNGIRFDATPATNAPSRLAYCLLEYSKAIGEGGGLYPYGGGAVSVVDFGGLSIENCILRHNLAGYGGAVFLYRHGNARLIGNLIADNHALHNGAALYCGYSHPELVNNTIVRNRIHNQEDPYIESCGVQGFQSRPALANNIIRNNDPEVWYMHSQIKYHKDYYTHHNNIEGYEALEDDIDADPMFVNAAGLDGVPGTFDDNLRLRLGSPCVDAGWDAAVPGSVETDLDGVPRFFDGDQSGPAIVDMGAYEAGDCDGDGEADADEISGGQAEDCNGNLLPDACEIDVFGTSLDCNGTGVPDECETIAGGDYDDDGSVDLVDFAYLSACLSGPGAAPSPADGRCLQTCLDGFDADQDGDVDLADTAVFSRQFAP